MNPVRIVILGSRGMLGTALTREFSLHRNPDEFFYKVFPLDRDQVEITNREEVFRVLSKFKPQIVMNAAAYTAVDDSEMNREKAFAANGDAVSHLAEFCRENRAVFVHFSTDYVFDGEKNDGYLETDSPHPINIYGESKFSGEQKILKSEIPFNTEFGPCGVYLIRTSWLFGPNGKNFVDTMLHLGREKKEIRVVNDQIGKPTYTIDLAKAIHRLLEAKMPFGIYHLTNEESVSWYEFAREIFHEFRSNSDISGSVPSDFFEIRVIPVSSNEFVRPARRPHNSILLNTKFPLLRSHSEALREYMKIR